MSDSESTVLEALANPLDPHNEINKPKRPRKKQHRWNPERKLTFLRIVELLKPFSAKYGTIVAAWEKVATEYNEATGLSGALWAKSARIAYEDFMHAYRKNENLSKKKSGEDEEHTEIDDILQNLDQLDKDAQDAADAETAAKRKKVLH